MSQSSRSYAPSISDISYRREPRESGATAPTSASSSLTPPSSLKRARRHPMQFPAGTTVETITMTTKEYSHRMDERIVYHDNVGVPIEDMILQAQDPRSHLHVRCGLSQRISDEHFCEKGYVCSYTLFDGSCEYPNIHSYSFAITYKHWSKAHVLYNVAMGAQQWLENEKRRQPKDRKHMTGVLSKDFRIVVVAITSIGPRGTIFAEIQRASGLMRKDTRAFERKLATTGSFNDAASEASASPTTYTMTPTWEALLNRLGSS